MIRFWVLASGVQELYAATAEADATPYIRRMQYASHGWSSEHDCSRGECVFERDAEGRNRPVAYSSLFSHASYMVASPLIVYAKVDTHSSRALMRGRGGACMYGVVHV